MHRCIPMKQSSKAAGSLHFDIENLAVHMRRDAEFAKKRMELASKHFNVTMEQRLGFGGIGWPCEPSVFHGKLWIQADQIMEVTSRHEPQGREDFEEHLGPR